MIRMDDQSAKDQNSTSQDLVPAASERSTAMQHEAYVAALHVERAAMDRAGKYDRVADVDAALEAAGYQAPPREATKPAKRTALPPKKSTRERPDPG